MSTPSAEALPARLLRAYRRTHYEAEGASVYPGRRAPAIDRLLRRHGVRGATFIASDNPYSCRMPDGWNRRMQTCLSAAARRYATLPATGSWRGWQEQHLLLLGDPRPAIRLARRFRQNAVVVVRAGQPARLIALM